LDGGVTPPMMRIEQVEARSVSVPLEQPVTFATREIVGRHYTLVRIHSNGLTGFGFCLGSPVVGPIRRRRLGNMTRQLRGGLVQRVFLLSGCQSLWIRKNLFKRAALAERRPP
jgi:hypothetical protein